MSYGGVDPALKKPPAPGSREPLAGTSRSGASPAAVLATLAICAAGGLVFGSIVGGTWYYARGRSVQASSGAQASSAPPVAPSLPAPPGMETSPLEAMHVRLERTRTDAQVLLERERTAFQERSARRHESLRQEIETRHAEMRDRMKQMRASAIEFPHIEPFPTPEFPEPIVPDFPTVVPDDTFPTRPDSAKARTHATPVARPPLIERPISVSYSRSAPRPTLSREYFSAPIPQTWSDPAEGRLERLQALVHDPPAFSSEASWFVRRRSLLTEELATRIEETIATFICESESPESVTVLPKLLYWYGDSDLPQLARLFVRLTGMDDETASLELRQTIVGTLQRYRRLDPNWHEPPAAVVLRAMRGSRTVSGHVIPTLETLPTPYCLAMEDLLLEIAFDGTPESTCAQRQALRDDASRDRLLEKAISRLESPDEVEREAAYMVLAATEPMPRHMDAALGAIASAFANESIEPSPLAHAALTLWLDEGHADSFDEFCECDCPIRRTAALAAIGRFRKNDRVFVSASTR